MRAMETSFMYYGKTALTLLAVGGASILCMFVFRPG